MVVRHRRSTCGGVGGRRLVGPPPPSMHTRSTVNKLGTVPSTYTPTGGDTTTVLTSPSKAATWASSAADLVSTIIALYFDYRDPRGLPQARERGVTRRGWRRGRGPRTQLRRARGVRQNPPARVTGRRGPRPRRGPSSPPLRGGERQTTDGAVPADAIQPFTLPPSLHTSAIVLSLCTSAALITPATLSTSTAVTTSTALTTPTALSTSADWGTSAALRTSADLAASTLSGGQQVRCLPYARREQHQRRAQRDRGRGRAPRHPPGPPRHGREQR